MQGKEIIQKSDPLPLSRRRSAAFAGVFSARACGIGNHVMLPSAGADVRQSRRNRRFCCQFCCQAGA
jgi:hypothetical protein